jgi:septum formation protein
MAPSDPNATRLVLASRSQRRAALLREAGFLFDQVNPPFDDPPNPAIHGRVTARDLASELAMKKAQSLKGTISSQRVILAADTICVGTGGELIGQPTNREEARAMIRGFVARDHDVVTGVAMLHTSDGHFICFADAATVTFGELADEQLDAYLDTHAWHGKAGGYNLYDRQRDGWPITVKGDPATVVGLPMQRLVRLLPQLGVKPRNPLALR